MPFVTNPLDGTPIAYDDSGGDGPAVVLLHGSALSRAIWRGLGYTPALAGFRTVRIDLRGHGRSGKPHHPDAYRMPLVAADVTAVMDGLGLEAAHVVGYSFGARVGFTLAATVPGRIRTLATLGGTYRAQAGQIAQLFFDGYAQALRDGGMPAFVAGLQGAGWTVDPATRAAFLANDPLALAAYFERTEVEPGLSEFLLPQLRLPALLLAGTRDGQRLRESRQAADLMPNARFVELPGRTHAGTLAPAGPVLGHLVPFLEGNWRPNGN
ncbi:alpha/beta fold hydrolase [Zafaria cholistanensis]|uniref:alpha/beta fold hydrolase n=1 Tax=Zafaria cholistanensis TaxID=1682741 RepID=UPI0012308575|nr:alpha/beta hydrolase [Zafaria cholistanensis]